MNQIDCHQQCEYFQCSSLLVVLVMMMVFNIRILLWQPTRNDNCLARDVDICACVWTVGKHFIHECSVFGLASVLYSFFNIVSSSPSLHSIDIVSNVNIFPRRTGYLWIGWKENSKWEKQEEWEREGWRLDKLAWSVFWNYLRRQKEKN